MTRLLIVAPAFNEGESIHAFIEAALSLREELAPDTDVRLLIVDDGSTDDTTAHLEQAVALHPESVGYVSLTANAGHQTALIVGLCHAGVWPDAIVTMDADLEHPMAVVTKLLRKWRETGAVVVHALRQPTSELPIVKRLLSRLFYRVTGILTGLNLVAGQADFRLWDANVLRNVEAYLPHIGSLRVFAAWLPGRHASVPYEQYVRGDRTSRFTLRQNYELAATSIIRFSHLPLRAITALGILGLTFSIVYGAFIAVAAFKGNTVPGWSSTVITVMAMGCLQLIAFGVLASYFRRLVFARDLPRWIVRNSRLTPAGENGVRPHGLPR